jgi:hypothetical protein
MDGKGEKIQFQKLYRRSTSAGCGRRQSVPKDMSLVKIDRSRPPPPVDAAAPVAFPTAADPAPVSSDISRGLGGETIDI